MKTFSTFLFFLLTLIISAFIFVTYLSINRLSESGYSDFSKMLDGTANRPTIYRLLVPTLAKAGAVFVPSALIDLVKHLPEQVPLKTAFDRLSKGRYPSEAIVTLLLLYLSIVGFMLVERALLRDLGYSLKEQLILPVALAVLILPFSVHFAYVYDLPEVFLFAICILCLYRRNWLAYLGWFAVAVTNKETSFFLVIIFALYYVQRLPRKTFAILLAAQLGIFAVLRIIITSLYRNNPGADIFWSIKYHVDQYTRYPSTLVVTVLFFGLIIFLMLKGWHKKPIFLRYSASMFFPMLGLYFLAGMPMEFRIFVDVLPVLGIMMFPHQNLPEPLQENARSVLQHGMQ